MTDKTLHIRRWTKREDDSRQNRKQEVPTISGRVLTERLDRFGFSVEDGEDLEAFVREIRRDEML